MKTDRIQDLLQRISAGLGGREVTNLSKLEYDVLMQNLRDLYSELDAARNQPKQEQEVQPDVIKPAPVVKRTINPNQNLLTEEPENKKPSVTEPVITKKEEPVVIAQESKPESKPEVKPETRTKETPVKSSINESIQSSSTLNEKHKGGSKEVHRKLSTRPLKDLIDLNKKFTLLNDLFKGNAEAFSAAIHHIDSSPTLEAAESFIKNELSSNYFWDEKSQSVRMFMKLVKQKFGEE